MPPRSPPGRQLSDRSSLGTSSTDSGYIISADSFRMHWLLLHYRDHRLNAEFQAWHSYKRRLVRIEVATAAIMLQQKQRIAPRWRNVCRGGSASVCKQSSYRFRTSPRQVDAGAGLLLWLLLYYSDINATEFVLAEAMPWTGLLHVYFCIW